LDHRHALETQAAERYLLGELPAREAEAFELHYFECEICAVAVESGQEFIGAAGEHFRTREPLLPPVKTAAPRRTFTEAIAAFLRPSFTMPALAALILLAAYQNAVTIPGMKKILNTARALPAMQLIGASRGDETVVHVPAGSPFASLAADVPPGTAFKEYICALSKDGRELSESISPAPADGQPITVLIPAGQLSAGSHKLTLFGRRPDGRRADKISTYPFSVQID
jgi:hypothetical protein